MDSLAPLPPGAADRGAGPASNPAPGAISGYPAPTRGAGGYLQRVVVAGSLYVPRRSRAAHRALSDYGKWRATADRWRRILFVCRQQIANPDGTPRRGLAPVARRAARVAGCHPPGYQVGPTGRTGKGVCGYPWCPFCYARRLRQGLARLRAAWQARPDRPAGKKEGPPGACGPGAVAAQVPCWAAAVTTFPGPATALRRLAARAGVAAGFGVKYQTPTGKWGHRGVFLADDRARLAALTGLVPARTRVVVRPVRGLYTLAGLLARACPYPRGWVKPTDPVGAVLAHLGRTRGVGHAFVPLGACREDYTPGRGRLDYAGHEVAR